MPDGYPPALGVALGNGHFGIVYQGTCPTHGDVAIKVIGRPLGRDDDDWSRYRASLVQEAQMMAQAAHPNVVRVHYVHHPAGAPDEVWLVMKRCAGSVQSLYDAGPLPLSQVRRIATHVAEGLAALHARGMLHRDIKPGNILFDSDGTFLLSDFGLVTDDLILGYGSAAGYNDHIAPEIWRGQGTSARSDLWALGMTVYRLLHGDQWYKEWYEGSGRPALHVYKGGFAARLRWLPHVPPAWRGLIRKALHDDPRSRFQSADAFLNKLARCPVEPEWNCSVTPTNVAWTRERNGRTLQVIWERQSARKHTWRADSLPTSAGTRNRLLGSSSGTVSMSVAIRELEGFFSS